MDPTQELTVLSALANGINPETGEILEQQSPYQSAKVIRALYIAISAVQAMPKAKRARKDTPNAGQPWTDTEDQQLLSLFEKGVDLSSIAKRHGRTIMGVQARLERHGKLPTRTSWRAGTGSPPSSTSKDPT